MLENIKKLEGIYNDNFDNMINKCIESAKKDLVMTGIAKSKVDNPDELVTSAIITYVRSFIDLDHSSLYKDSYNLQKDHLRHFNDYQEKDVQ